jgi:hypothetical protein
MTPEQQELLDRFADGADLIRNAATLIPPDQLDQAPAVGEWSGRQVLVHLLDSELVGAGRFRQLLAEDHPDLYMYDQAGWAEHLGYAAVDPAQALELAATIRSDTAALLRRVVTAESWLRTAIHARRGPMDLVALLQLYIGHVEGHLEQLRSIVAALDSSGTV